MIPARHRWAYDRRRGLKNIERQYPQRRLLQLYKACQDADLGDIEREWEVHDPYDHRYLWFNIAARAYDRLVFIDLMHNTSRSGLNQKRRKVFRRKQRWTAWAGIPYLLLSYTQDSGALQVKIRTWLLKEVRDAKTEESTIYDVLQECQPPPTGDD